MVSGAWPRSSATTIRPRLVSIATLTMSGPGAGAVWARAGTANKAASSKAIGSHVLNVPVRRQGSSPSPKGEPRALARDWAPAFAGARPLYTPGFSSRRQPLIAPAVTAVPIPQHPALPADWRDLLALTKPRVMSLVVFTGLCGLLAAPVPIHPVLGFTAVLCIALGAGAAGALNQWYEADLDAKMKRTANRPLPAGRMDRQTALHFGVGSPSFR